MYRYRLSKYNKPHIDTWNNTIQTLGSQTQCNITCTYASTTQQKTLQLLLTQGNRQSDRQEGRQTDIYSDLPQDIWFSRSRSEATGSSRFVEKLVTFLHSHGYQLLHWLILQNITLMCGFSNAWSQSLLRLLFWLLCIFTSTQTTTCRCHGW